MKPKKYKTLYQILEEFYKHGERQPSQEQTIKKFTGYKLSFGKYRDVYVLKDNPNYVLKMQRSYEDGNFANAVEYRNWVNLRKKPIGKYLAPCHTVSMDGAFLIQTRVLQSQVIAHYPKKIPNLFTDNKIQNYGWIRDQFVCCDYSYLLIGVQYKLKKVKWWCENKRLGE